MNKMNQTQTRSPRKRLLSLILAVILMIGLLPISAFATSASAQANDSGTTAESQEFLRIFHLDCGRKYFTVSEIEGIIDQLAENHYTHIQLAFGNDGLRFLLDDMSVTVNGTEYSSDNVKNAIKTGNSGNGLAGAAAGVLDQSEMDTILDYAKKAGIEVIPMFNAPGHMYTAIKAMNSLGIGGKYSGTSDASSAAKALNWSIGPTDSTAVAYAEALLTKYVKYFAGKDCTKFNIGADESGLSSSNYAAYAEMVNAMNKIVKGEGMTTLAYNDGIYNTTYATSQSSVTFDNDIIICYWTTGDGIATAEFLSDKGFKILNNTNNWYYVLGDGLYKWNVWGSGGQWGYESAVNGLKSTKVTQVKGDEDTNAVTPVGSVLCCWCDVPSIGYMENGVNTSQSNRQSVYNLIAEMAKQNPDYFKETKPELSVGTAQGVTVSAAKDGKYQVILPENGGGTVQLSVKNLADGQTAVWASNEETIAAVNANGLVTFTGTTGTVTITATVPSAAGTESAAALLSNTNDNGTATYSVTFEVKEQGAATKTEDIVLTVGGTKTVTVDGVQAILTQPDAQYATVATKGVPSETVSYTASASASTDIRAYGGNDVSNLIDGNTGTYFFSDAAPGVGAYVQVDLKKAIPFDAVRLTSCGDDFCKNAAVKVSADGDNWTTIGSYTGSTTATTFDVNGNIGSVRYIRVEITEQVRANNGNYCWWKLAEIEWGNYDNGTFTRMETSGTVTVPEQTQITFTGVAVGNTVARIGDTEYNIQVKGRVEIPISIIDYRADGLLFDYSYADSSYGNYPDSYRYSLVHGRAEQTNTYSSTNVAGTWDSSAGIYYVDGNGSKVESIPRTRIEQTGPVGPYGTAFFTNSGDNSWSRAGLVKTQLGTNGMPVYTEDAVQYVASLLKAGYYNDVSDSDYNCNSYIYKTFVAADGKRSIHNESATEFSAQFEVTKSYNDIKTAYDLAWYLLNTIYQPDTEATVPVTDVDGQQREVPLYGMAVDTYKSIVLTADGNKYTFEAGYSNNPKNVLYDKENGTISNGGGTSVTGFYPLESLGYEQPGLLTNTSRNDGLDETTGRNRNGSFTLRGESQFVYNKDSNLYFTFTGDDDVYMYINGVLALDLGGAHGRNTKKVQLDKLDKDTYKLKDGEVATFTFFYMERCSDASTFAIETNMELVQRDIAVEKNAYSDSGYKTPVASGAVVDNGRSLFYDLVVANLGNTTMTDFTFEDTDTFTGKANLGYDVTDASVTAGSKDKDKNLVSLSANGYTYFVTDADGNQVGETKTCDTLDALSTAVAGVNLAAKQSLHVRFLKATVDVAPSKIISYTNTIKVTASAGGARLWDDGSHSIYAYNDGGTARTYVVDFGLPLNITKIFDPSAKDYINGAAGNIELKQQPQYGTAELTANGYDSSVRYQLKTNTTIDGQDTITLNVPYKFDNAERTLPKTLNIIPASNVYYEDSLASFTPGSGVAKDATWSKVDNDDKAATEKTDVYQALQQLGDKKIYGYDDAYNKDNSSMLSMGTAHKVTVTSAMADTNAWKEQPTSAWPTASFTFTGTGFDIISLTDNTSGAILVKVTGENYNKNFLVDNYYGYNYNEKTGEWTTDKTGGNNALYQIPVMKVTDLPHGTYNVTIQVFFNEFFDGTESGTYNFWLDAIRIYNPMGDYADYTKDNEGYPQYIQLHDELVKTAEESGEKKLVFIDGAASATIAEYANYGPNNEVYLANGQAISFKLTGADVDKIASVQIGAKAPKGTAVLNVNSTDIESSLSTATEMYYDITTQVTGGSYQVTITNNTTTTDNILSLTNLKITYKTTKPAEDEKVTLAALDTQEQENAVNLVRALFTAPMATFSPETFQADWGRAVRAGKRATLTVKTSADVESITVDGVTVTSYTTRTERTGWGWWSPKVTYHVFTYTTTAPAQTTDYAVCAVNAEGTASEPITATLTVRPATWWNWWF